MSLPRFLLVLCIVISNGAFAQNTFATILEKEYQAGHFNGAALVVQHGKVVARVNRGFANMQFAVPVSNSTRFPIASMTKTFTAILILQLVEKGQLRLEDNAARYVPDLPADCQHIPIKDLLTHYSGLQNEPIPAYKAQYSTTEYVKKYVVKKEPQEAPAFHYTNVDYVLLTRIAEVVAKKPFARLLQDNILTPLGMHDSGIIKESVVTPALAYGYHNYTFGAGTKADTLLNDSPWYLSNYAGAGAMYSTPEDIYKLVQGLKSHRLLSAKTTAAFLTKPQQPVYMEGIRGYPTLGLYYNDKTFARPLLERRGSINGFNSALLTDLQFDNVVILLTNTDTADLELLGDKLYREIK
jgi:CubicO group peptidase (beta-lactamase class C family)